MTIAAKSDNNDERRNLSSPLSNANCILMSDECEINFQKFNYALEMIFQLQKKFFLFLFLPFNFTYYCINVEVGEPRESSNACHHNIIFESENVYMSNIIVACQTML